MEEMQFVQVINLSEESNKVVNKAIYLAHTTKCKYVTSVHLFMALMKNTTIAQKVIKNTGISYSKLMETYNLANNAGAFGYSEHGVDIPDGLSNDLDNVFALLSPPLSSMRSFKDLMDVVMRKVGVEELFETTLKANSEILNEFLTKAGIDAKVLLDVIKRESQIKIPDSIKNFAEDLNAKVRKSTMKISGVDDYTDELIEVLSRKLKANPCLVGEAGVGKTTVAYALADRINSGNVPKNLENTHVIGLNSSLLTAGTRYRGDFEERMLSLLEWAAKNDVILFFDEIHNFVSLNKEDSGAGSAGNMIKKYLSDGSIRILGATTPKEFHSSIEKDKALSRRIQKVTVNEPDEATAIEIIHNTISEYEHYHKVAILDGAIENAVKLSSRYMKNKFLPDKAYTILDQAAAKAKISGTRIVKSEDVEQVVSKLTGINVSRLNGIEGKQLMNLEETIHKEIVGQDNAVSTVSKAIRRAKAGVHEPNKPLASFLFVGPTGVGKTALCKELSKLVAFGKTPLIKVDMSEYSEKYSISKMIGSAPGYVGYGEGGQLTEKVKNNPHSIILFDEIEKAHPDVFNVFLQMLDEGRLTDGEGETADLTNCIIVMTSNAGYGADGMQKGAIGFGAETVKNDTKEVERKAIEALESTFKPEFLNRLDGVVVFDKLTKENCNAITKLALDKLADRLMQQNIKVKFNDSIVKHVTELGYSDKYGARNIHREVQYTVEDNISDYIISGKLNSGDSASVSYIHNKVVIKVNKGEK